MTQTSASPPPLPQPAPHRPPMAVWLVSTACAAAVAVLAAALLWQGHKDASTGMLEAPTPPPLPTPQLPAVAELPSTPPRIAPPFRAPASLPAGALSQVPPSMPQTMPMPAAPIAAQPAPPEASLPPTPTPTPELAGAFTCRKGIFFDVKPDRALVTINGEPVGKASQWKDKDKPFELRREGVYFVRLSCRDCRTMWFKVTADDKADDKLVEIKARLEK